MLTSTTNVKRHTENGVTTDFPFDFKVDSPTELQVDSIDLAGVPTRLSYPGDFTVTGLHDNDGGYITKVAGTNGFGLLIRRVTPIDQTTKLRGQTALDPVVLEDALDKLTKIAQQHAEELDRTLHSSVEGVDTELPEPVAGYALGWDVTGMKLVNVPNTGADQSADLADTADPVKGAGKIGFDPDLTYPAGSVGPYVKTGYESVANLAASFGSSLVGFMQSGTGAVHRTVQDKGRDIKDPRDYGLWDGKTTDLAAITACITATAEGGTVEIPDGDINLGTGLVIPKALTLKLGSGDYTASANPVISWAVRGVHLEGSGAHQLSLATNIIAATAAGNAIEATGNTGYDFSSIRGLNVIGNATADAGIYLQGGAKGFVTCEDIWIADFTKATGKCYHLAGIIAGIFTNCHAADSHFGYYLTNSGATTSNLNQFYGCNTVSNEMNI